MKCTILLSAAFISVSLLSNAQDTKKTYAITGKQNNSFLWADIKQVDITTGKVVKTLFESDKTVFKTINFDNNKQRPVSQQEASPTALGVAACALDAKHNRLYFAPMHFSDIRFLDLDKDGANFTTVKRNIIAMPAMATFQPEENQVTRMVFAADGYGYALTNDANHFIRFTTGRKPVVEDMGSLADDETNKGISIHNKCTSWGGDMLADAFGKLVIITASHNVFSVDVNTKVATMKGTISGLPANYTTNGAVVDNDGYMVVSSANVFDGLFRVDIKDLKAVKIPGTENSFNASDLANGNFLLQKEADAINKFEVPKSVMAHNYDVSDARVYPNPVTNNQFNVLFEGKKAGRYTVQLTDISGRAILSKTITIAGGNQVEPIRFAQKMPRGMFLIKVLDENKRLAFSDKVVIL